MLTPDLPAILIPIFGIFLPGLTMGVIFLYIEQESVI